MRIDGMSHSVDSVGTKPVESQTVNLVRSKEVKQPEQIQSQQISSENHQDVPKEKLKQAVDSMNEFFEINNSELKFVFHEGLEKYFVQLVNAQTEEVVREIPSKKMLDVFYEMQKLVGMIVDEKI